MAIAIGTHARFENSPIYGEPFGITPQVPKNISPIFIAQVQDDDLASAAIVKFGDALKAEGNKPEAHIFSVGGHIFGVKKQGTMSDGWINEFYYWFETRRLTKHVGTICRLAKAG